MKNSSFKSHKKAESDKISETTKSTLVPNRLKAIGGYRTMGGVKSSSAQTLLVREENTLKKRASIQIPKKLESKAKTNSSLGSEISGLLKEAIKIRSRFKSKDETRKEDTDLLLADKSDPSPVLKRGNQSSDAEQEDDHQISKPNNDFIDRNNNETKSPAFVSISMFTFNKKDCEVTMRDI
mmetsp:Transcript_3436/g.4040  ORF Transcript_3436/g.4040 Transcript_3436/m.4040 type:complete len:181 (+) Transcript_3436:119-661(+)